MDPGLEERLCRMSREMGFDPYSDTPFRDLALRAEDGSSDPPPPDSLDFHDDDNDHRCDCGLCGPTPTALEQVCCRDILEVVRGSPDGCITTHEEFRSMCLSSAVLRALYWELQENGVGVEGERLGRRNRVVLPVCVVTAIRKQFPSADYVGFRYPPL
ncbi:hypothetical protein HPB52_006439 [Rhipicephalus sanguineus]|uniref:P2X purinoreceptor 7 intracellular domain-containing protein n=1 Tax=Rhipicephalus sanguineus TaxID=34632 RepID=A0A9D4STV2_RHISA|nr:hypothetical protein HPB52_006439 [Rhipicephalus sanguineus]